MIVFNRFRIFIFFNITHNTFQSVFYLIKDTRLDIPVILVGNKTDLEGERMVCYADGYKRYKEISCSAFHEISVRENPEEVYSILHSIIHLKCVYYLSKTIC